MAAGWHSYISIKPPMYGIAVAPERYTHHLIRNSGFFGVNFLPGERSESIQQVGVATGHEQDKLSDFGLDYEDGLTANVPILVEAYVAYECSLVDVQSYGDHDWFVGTITQFYRDEDLFLENGLPNLARLEIPLYLGRSEYAILDTGARHKRHYIKGPGLKDYQGSITQNEGD
jgi:flavin reductase (DIM6/NTAB) family NADH-FMN oxidoreductase RutF